MVRRSEGPSEPRAPRDISRSIGPKEAKKAEEIIAPETLGQSGIGKGIKEALTNWGLVKNPKNKSAVTKLLAKKAFGIGGDSTIANA